MTKKSSKKTSKAPTKAAKIDAKQAKTGSQKAPVAKMAKVVSQKVAPEPEKSDKRDTKPAKNPVRVEAARAGGAAGKLLELRYTLAELPSSQHRAGLAGLVLMTNWLAKQKRDGKGVCELAELGPNGMVLRIDQAGLGALFDAVYKASAEEQAYPAPFKNKEPARTEIVESIDAKGKTKSKTVYIYPVTVPDGAFIVAWDKTHTPSRPGLWVKLWRDMVWSILRGVPATRRPFELRADGEPTKDAEETWTDLQRGDRAVELPSTYFLGVQSSTAEGVPFRDRARFQFLLNFWPFIAQIYVPVVIDNEGKTNHTGYAIAVPDVADLEFFCEELQAVLTSRTAEDDKLAGYRPRGAVIDLSVEGGLDFFVRLKRQLQRREGQRATGDLVLGVDVFHMEKEGNNIRLRSFGRVEPDDTVIDEYARVHGILWNPLFRRQRIANLIARKPHWFHGFDRLMATTPYEQTIGNDFFRHDARILFQQEVDSMTEPTDTQPSPLPAILYRLVGAYISGKIANKYDVKYSEAMSEEQRGKYREYREKIARDAFLAIRSRTGVDFVDFFTATLCSVPQHMKETDFQRLSLALLHDQEREQVRTLTLLALSARG